MISHACYGVKSVRIIALVATLAAANTAEAAFHIWPLNEFFSTADGQVQFIEFSTAVGSQQFLAGHELRVTETAPPNATHSFVFPSNLPGDSANKTFIVATPGFAALPGGVTPDYTVPTGFLFTAGATVQIVGGLSGSYTNLVLDGITSVSASGVPAVNSPRNFAGVTGSVDLSASPPSDNTNYPITLIAISNSIVTLGWTATTTQAYDITFSTEPRLAGAQAVVVAAHSIKPALAGAFLYSDLPYLASPQYAANSNGFYALQVRPVTQTPLRVTLDVVASNFVAPVTLTHAGDGSGRRFVADQPGKIWIIDTNNIVLSPPFLDVSNQMVTLTAGYDERGLLGLAFHPQYTNNGRFFIYYSAPKSGSNINHESIVAEYQVSSTNANAADPTTATIVLRLDEPQSNHNGGALAFGPDGYLYISFGDGGGQNDGLNAVGLPHGLYGNGQNTNTMLGSIVRIDVDGAPPYAIPPDNPFVSSGGLDEIYAYGFRNPFRMSFDRGGTNALFVADVGQNIYEEINIVNKGDNGGWRILEGSHAFDVPLAADVQVALPSIRQPIHEYTHALGISVIGGYVYRGSASPDLVGKYVFGDFSTSFGFPNGQVFYLAETRPGLWERFAFELAPTNGPLGRYVKGFGEDEAGELYLLSTLNLGPGGTSGDVRQIREDM